MFLKNSLQKEENKSSKLVASQEEVLKHLLSGRFTGKEHFMVQFEPMDEARLRC
jgi:hypothetical protein